MINLITKEDLNLGILETDFTIFSDIVNTFIDESEKNEYLIDIDNYVVPEYFRNKMTVVIKSSEELVGYTVFQFKNINNVYQSQINRLYVLDSFKNKQMEDLLIETVTYISSEVGARNVIVNIDDDNLEVLNMYKKLGFYEVGISEVGSLLSVNVNSFVASRNLNVMFRDIPKDFVDYKSLKLVKKISSGKESNIYLTNDGQILKLFSSNSFVYIKDREETIKKLKKLDIKEVVKPRKLVYYDGIFIGYIMDYLPDGKSLWENHEKYSFEEKIDKIKNIEEVIKKLHKKNIYVCNMDPNNIFIDKNGDVKIIDCDSFVVKNEVLNLNTSKKYRDPIYKIISEKTDLYAFAIMTLELLTNITISNNSSKEIIEKQYNKNKNKLPVSFKQYFDSMFKTNERIYLSESYEKYLNELYNSADDNILKDNKSGNISIIILSIIMLIIAVIGYFVLKNM